MEVQSDAATKNNKYQSARVYLRSVSYMQKDSIEEQILRYALTPTYKCTQKRGDKLSIILGNIALNLEAHSKLEYTEFGMQCDNGKHLSNLTYVSWSFMPRKSYFHDCQKLRPPM